VVVVHLIPLAEQFEPDRAVLLVGAPGRHQLADVFLVDVAALALPVGTVGAADFWTLVPVHSEPGEAVVDEVQVLLAVALLVRVLDAQHEDAPRVAGVEPVEQRRTGAADVEEPGWTGREADADLGHEIKM
jgi:hypothetical protein